MQQNYEKYPQNQKISGSNSTMELLKDIKWQCKTNSLNRWIEDSSYSTEQLHSGMEGDAYKLIRPLDELSIVCKIWNRTSKPDPFKQYRLLQYLSHYDIPVSEVLGCGTDTSGNPLLVTSFDGFPLAEDEGHDITTFAKLLTQIHNIPVTNLGLIVPEEDTVLRKLVQYFFPMIDVHGDIKDVVDLILHNLKPDKVALIHGDYNLGNIVHVERNYCLIDWTNAQISDSRYDLAWASFLIKIYNNEELYHSFKESYLRERHVESEDYEYFEIMAFLRWVLLSRIAEIPMGEYTDTD
jgi:aminoglycoside phosphotransferase (APT) family kinase protein